MVIAIVIGVADSIFCHRKSRGGSDRKRKTRGGERIACNDIKRYRGEKDNPTRIYRVKDG
jgi:hypothetical protein